MCQQYNGDLSSHGQKGPAHKWFGNNRRPAIQYSPSFSRQKIDKIVVYGVFSHAFSVLFWGQKSDSLLLSFLLLFFSEHASNISFQEFKWCEVDPPPQPFALWEDSEVEEMAAFSQCLETGWGEIFCKGGEADLGRQHYNLPWKEGM